MDEPTTPSSPNPSDPSIIPPSPLDSAATPRPKRRAKRRWFRLVGLSLLGLLVLLVLLIALLPTIASSGWARSTVVDKVNRQIDGRFEIADWSFGWGGNVRIDGVRLFDNQNRQIFALAHLTGGKVKIWDAIHGRYDLGKFTIDGIEFKAERDLNGILNFSKLAKNQKPETAPAPAPAKKSEPTPESQSPPELAKKEKTSASKLPDVSAEFALTNCRGTYDDLQKKQTIQLDSLTADLKIPNINAPIENQLDLVARVNNGAPGTIDLKGKTLAVHDNRLMSGDEFLHQAELNESVALTNFDLASLSPLFGPGSALSQMAGKSVGRVTIDVQPNQGAKLNMQFACDDLLIGNLRASMFSTNANGTLDDKGFKLGSKTYLKTLVNEHPAPGAQPTVLSNWLLTVASQASIVQSNGGSEVTLNELQIGDSDKLFNVAKSPDGTFQVATSADGAMSGAGKILLNADLVKINELLRNLAAAPADKAADESNRIALGSGQLSGDVAFASTQDHHVNLTSDMLVSSLSMKNASASTTAPAILNDDKIALTAQLSAKDDLSAVESGKIVVDGSLVNASLTDLSLKLKNPGKDGTPIPTLQILRNAVVKIDVPSLAKLSATMKAFSTASAAQPLLDQLALAGGALPATLPSKHPPATIITLTNGSLGINCKASGDGQHLNLSANADAKDVAFNASKNVPQDAAKPKGATRVQQVDHTVGSADFAMNVAIETADGKTITDQIRQLVISQLSAHAVGTEIALKQPLTLTDLSSLSHLTKPSAQSPTSVSAPLSIKGDLTPAFALLEAMDAEQPGAKYPYSGTFAFDEGLGSNKGALFANGGGDVTNFQVHDAATKAVSFTEPTIHLSNDVQMTGQSASINDLSLAMVGSKALSLAVKGKVDDLSKQRLLEHITADLTYDLAQLWKIVYPTLSAEDQKAYKDAQVAGQFTKHFVVSGSYPAGVPFEQAIKNVFAQGGLSVGSFKGRGIDLQNLDLPVIVKDGIATVANSDKAGDYAKPAALNTGQLSLAGAAVDLSDPHPRLNTPANLAFLKGVALNPTLADALGEKVGNFLFQGAQQATGILTVIITKCEKFPLDKSATEAVPSNDGYLALDVSISNLTLASPSMTSAADKFSSALKGVNFLGSNQKLAPESLRGDIKSYKIVISHGVTTHDMTLAFGENQRPLHLSGDVTMQTQAMKMNLELPLKLLGLSDPKLESLMPNGISLPIGGSVNAPQFDVSSAVQKTFVSSDPKDIVNKLGGLFGNKPKQNPASPAAPDPVPANTPPPAAGQATPPVTGGPTTTPSSSTQPAANNNAASGDSDADQAITALQGLFDKQKKKKPKKPRPTTATAPATAPADAP